MPSSMDTATPQPAASSTRSAADLDFSKEDFDVPVEFYDGCWVIANKHCPGLNETTEINNRVFVFRLVDKQGRDVLLVLGAGDERTLEATKQVEKDTGLRVEWVVGNGGAHHLFLGLWYDAFPNARILVPAKRIPATRNGKKLQQQYADRWELAHGPRPTPLIEEFGDQIDVVIFDQLHTYSDQASGEVFGGEALDYRSKRLRIGGLSMMMKMGKLMKDFSQPTDEVTFFHRRSGLVVGGHNYQLSYRPKGHKPTAEHKLAAGPFPVGLIFKMMMPAGRFVSNLESAPCPIADPAAHAQQWQMVLDWDMVAWTSAHNPPTVLGPDLSRAELKAAIRASLARTGEDDPTGTRLDKQP